jgi:integrase
MSIERERQAASLVCQFLNYVRDRSISYDEDFLGLKDKGLLGLNLIHGSLFLDYQDNQTNRKGQRVRKDTVDRKEYLLTKFYSFLQKQGVITQDFVIETYRNEKGKLIKVSPFTRKRGNEQKRPVEKDLRDFGENRQKILVEFIDTAKSMKWGKTIALGLACGGFGGLRRGEIVNLTTGSIEQIGKSLNIKIEDRQVHLFAHKKNTAKEGVKKPRPQNLLPSEYLIDLYQEHLVWLKDFAKKTNLLVKDALFVNRAGRPLTGKGYEKLFKSVVKKYLNILISQERYEDYSFLTSRPFNTHTLRGVYTNICLDDLGMNVRETANFRGDADDNSVSEYLDELTGKKKAERSIQLLSKAVVEAEACKEFVEQMKKKDEGFDHTS